MRNAYLLALLVVAGCGMPKSWLRGVASHGGEEIWVISDQWESDEAVDLASLQSRDSFRWIWTRRARVEGNTVRGDPSWAMLFADCREQLGRIEQTIVLQADGRPLRSFYEKGELKPYPPRSFPGALIAAMCNGSQHWVEDMLAAARAARGGNSTAAQTLADNHLALLD